MTGRDMMSLTMYNFFECRIALSRTLGKILLRSLWVSKQIPED